MKIHLLKKEQFLRQPLDKVFAFFAKPENLEKITPASLSFRILTPAPILMEKGRIIDYQIKIMGLPQRWRSIISDYQPPHFFVDEQLKGPYSFWHHTHRFSSKDGGTLIIDEVRYGLSFGMLGNLAHALFVRSQLESIFNYRAQVIERLIQ